MCFVVAYFLMQVLPRPANYKEGPAAGDSLKAHLVKNMTSTNSQLSLLTATLLFAICNNNRELDGAPVAVAGGF